MTRALVLSLALAAVAGAAHADPRIRELRFDPAAVAGLQGCPGFQSTVAFAPGEHIENIAVGDANLWQAIPNKRADLLFLKPLSRAAHTNMTVVTDRRRYSFELSAAAAETCRAGRVVYDLRFTYPDEPVPEAALTVAAAVAAPPAPPEDPAPPPAQRNTAYSYSGAAAAVPQRVFDDGRATWFRWADLAAAPAVYAVGADKAESVINFTMRGDYMVVEAVAPAFVLRRGAVVATLHNDAWQAPRLDEAAPRPRVAAVQPKPQRRWFLARLFAPRMPTETVQ